MLAFCFHFLTLMAIICSTIISTANSLGLTQHILQQMTDIRKDLLLKVLEANRGRNFCGLTDHNCKVIQRATEALMKGTTRALPRKGIWPSGNGGTFLWLSHQRSLTSPYRSAPASKSFFIAVHRASEFRKPQNWRGTSWHKNEENSMGPMSSIWSSRRQTENRSGINVPGYFQKAHPRYVEHVLREETIWLLLWKESELSGKCVHFLQTREINIYYWKSNSLFQKKKLISIFLFRIWLWHSLIFRLGMFSITLS